MFVQLIERAGDRQNQFNIVRKINLLGKQTINETIDYKNNILTRRTLRHVVSLQRTRVYVCVSDAQ